MSKINTIIVMAAVTIMFGGTADAQYCSSCNGGAVGSEFGYPGASACSCGQDSRHERWDQLKAENAKITARNDAWPKPFACIDRQNYHEIWSPMIDQGFEEQCCLSAAHFDAETNELNQFGISAVAGIMQNMPTGRKNVYVNRDANESISQTRLTSVNSVVQTMYGQIAPNAQVTLSNKMPASVSGTIAENLSKRFILAAPKPIIPIATGKQSVASTVAR